MPCMAYLREEGGFHSCGAPMDNTITVCIGRHELLIEVQLCEEHYREYKEGHPSVSKVR